jgi:hypothetical protein
LREYKENTNTPPIKHRLDTDYTVAFRECAKGPRAACGRAVKLQGEFKRAPTVRNALLNSSCGFTAGTPGFARRRGPLQAFNRRLIGVNRRLHFSV